MWGIWETLTYLNCCVWTRSQVGEAVSEGHGKQITTVSN